MLIGCDGMHLKNITQSTGMHYIWSTRNENADKFQNEHIDKISNGVIQIWGMDQLLPNAIQNLHNHIKNTLLDISYNILNPLTRF